MSELDKMLRNTQLLRNIGDTDVNTEAFREFLKSMEFFKRNRAWTPPVIWGIDLQKQEPEEEMSQEEYLLILAERILGCYTKATYVDIHEVKCRCGYYEKVKLKQLIDGVTHHRAHAGLCINCETLFIHVWDKKKEGN